MNMLINDQTSNRVADHTVVEVKAFHATEGSSANLGIITSSSRR